MQQSIHSLCKSLGGVSGQTRDEVHVDLVKTGLPCLLERAEHVCRAVFSADCGQNSVIHALWVDAHAANARAFEHAQLFRCDGIRTSRFYSIFAQMRKIKVIFERRQQPCQLMLVQRSRCAAADVDALHLLARCADKRGCLLDLAAERVQIRLDEFTGLRRGCRYERAVIAPRRAERNTDVQRNIVFPDGLVHLHRGCGRADGQRRALG